LEPGTNATKAQPVVPSKGFKFNPAHAVRDTFGTKPAGGRPKDYYAPQDIEGNL